MSQHAALNPKHRHQTPGKGGSSVGSSMIALSMAKISMNTVERKTKTTKNLVGIIVNNKKGWPGERPASGSVQSKGDASGGAREEVVGELAARADGAQEADVGDDARAGVALVGIARAVPLHVEDLAEIPEAEEGRPRRRVEDRRDPAERKRPRQVLQRVLVPALDAVELVAGVPVAAIRVQLGVLDPVLLAGQPHLDPHPHQVHVVMGTF